MKSQTPLTFFYYSPIVKMCAVSPKLQGTYHTLRLTSVESPLTGLEGRANSPALFLELKSQLSSNKSFLQIPTLCPSPLYHRYLWVDEAPEIPKSLFSQTFDVRYRQSGIWFWNKIGVISSPGTLAEIILFYVLLYLSQDNLATQHVIKAPSAHFNLISSG